MANEKFVRITSITLDNFKNTTHGEIILDSQAQRDSVLVLYGENGSGKTSLIDSLQLLKYLLCGKSVPSRFFHFIKIDQETAHLKFTIAIHDKNQRYHVEYGFGIRKVKADQVPFHAEDNNSNSDLFQVQIFDELLKYGSESEGKKKRLSAFIDLRQQNNFLPRSRYFELFNVASDKSIEMDVLLARRIAEKTAKSSIFCADMMSLVKERCQKTEYKDILEALAEYGRFGLFIVNSEDNGLINLNTLPLYFKYRDIAAKTVTVGNIPLKLMEPSFIPDPAWETVQKVIDNMNIVLCELIPGMQIKIDDLGAEICKTGEKGRKIEFVSDRHGKEIPIRYESDGIKKIISVLQLLIVMYNFPSITVAVDELDSGIFEYLLGELLRIITENGKGQLIFTAHNLRPLETISKDCICFTTPNPNNRYLRPTNIKKNNNLRDVYYHESEKGARLYEPIDNDKIINAFKEAGKVLGSEV